jgi:raffinose/stachyose/melibiose transport system substrate-binding protein
MRKIGMLLAAAVVAIAPAACAPGTSGGGDGNVHLTVLSWRPEDTAGYQKIFAVYEKSHPKVTIDFKGIKNTEYATVLPTELAKSQGGPDIVQLKPYGPIQSLIAAGDLVSLDGHLNTAGWPANVLQAAKGQRDGKLYGIPYALQTLQVLYNKKIFAAQGMTPPATWADMLSDCGKLKKAGIVPMATSGLQPWVLAIDHQIFGVNRYGGDAFDAAVKSGAKNFTDPGYEASLSVIDSLKPCFPSQVTGVDYPDAQTLFSSGKAAMYPGGSYEVGPFLATTPDLQIGFFNAPPSPGSPIAQPLTSGYVDGSYGVNAKSAHRAQALDLIDWMATPQFGRLFANLLKQIPAVPGTAPSDPLLKQMLADYQAHGATYMMVVDFGYGDPLGRDQEGTALQKMLGGTSQASAGQMIQKGISAWFKPTAG